MRGGEGLDKRTLLAEHFLLRHLQPADLDELSRYARIEHFKAGEVVIGQGSPGTGMMAVVKGRVKISTVSAAGREVVLELINPGEVFGEIALLDGKERTADVVTLEPTELLVLERRDFLPFLERHPHTCVKLMTVLCGRMRQTNELVMDSLFLDLRARLAKRLLRFARLYGVETEDGGVRIDLKLPQRELAAMIGVARENVNKQLRAWQEEGTISVKAGIITLVEPEELEGQVSDFD
jgi:CRP-like cAMP-binding protein